MFPPIAPTVIGDGLVWRAVEIATVAGGLCPPANGAGDTSPADTVKRIDFLPMILQPVLPG
jgi:hypothetical protein